MQMKLAYPLAIKNNFLFRKNSQNFVVNEIPLYEFSGEGEHLVVKVRKKDMDTWQMIEIIAKHLGIPKKEIGYAGLKDKDSMSMQYISIFAKHETKLSTFEDNKIKVLSTTRHNNKIKLGHLKGNHFKIKLKKVLGINKDKLDSALEWISKNGVPNYFGTQRFGTTKDNYLEGKDIIDGKKKMRNKKIKDFLIRSYQSYLFNQWLSFRIEISLLLEKFSEEETEKSLNLAEGSLLNTKEQPHFLKLLEGDTMMHYPYGKIFNIEDKLKEATRFTTKDISLTGALYGKTTNLNQSPSQIIEDKFRYKIPLIEQRRYAWVFPEEIKKEYIPEKAHYEFSFFLPKGSYATNVINVLNPNSMN